ncbi:MAG: sodium ion-translocating decarboxylase subunit beta, partial [Clostridia bacterium]|nr:sodium ion-translocating decarboxylase subunit beta [Clostridia bacterium]
MLDAILDFLGKTGFAKMFAETNWWQYLVMYVIVGVLFYLAIVKKFEPLLLMPIAFGMLLANLPGAELIHLEYFFDDYYISVVDGEVTGSLSAAMNTFLDSIQPTLYTLGEDSLTFNLQALSAKDVEIFNSLFVMYLGESATITDGAVHIRMSHIIKEVVNNGGLLDVLYLGVKLGVYPSLIFLGVGAMTDFSPLIANPKSLLMGAGAQL